MKTYLCRVIIEPDENFDGNPDGWHAYCPALVKLGASAWGRTREEALVGIQEAIEMTIAGLLDNNEDIPPGEGDDMLIFEGSRVAVTVP